MTKLKELKTKSGNLQLPVFFPDATKAVIKGVAADELLEVNTDGLVVNTYHLMHDDMVDLISNFGGIHKFMGFHRPVISDSGGFQVMSLIRENPKNGRINDDGIEFNLSLNEGLRSKARSLLFSSQKGRHSSPGLKAMESFISENKNSQHIKKTLLTPATCIDTQIKIGSDIVMCLDDCTNPKESTAEQEKSVERTIKWAKICKEKFLEQTQDMINKPLLFGIVQGGNIKELRKICAEELIKIGFDGYAYGGWPVDENRNFLTEILSYVASLMPDDKPKYAMGVGKPQDITSCFSMGYNMFDCVLPTRDARHKRLYVFNPDWEEKLNGVFYKYLNLENSVNKNSQEKISDVCDCKTCENYTRGYLYHLFKIKDATSVRLATIHNLRLYSMLMEKLRKE